MKLLEIPFKIFWAVFKAALHIITFCVLIFADW